MHLDVGHRCRRQVLLQRLPVLAGVERHEEAELGAGIEEAGLLGILADDAGRVIAGDAVLAVGQQRPGLAVVVGAIDVRLEVVLAHVPVGREISAALHERRVLDGLDARADQFLGRHVLPRLAVVARHADRSVVGAHPDHALLKARLDHRVDSRVDLLARHVARDRIARDDLVLRLLGRQVRADDLPGDALVDRAMQHVRRLVDDPRVVRRDIDHGLAREAVLDVVGVVSVTVLRIDPVVLLLAGDRVVAADFALAGAPHHLAVWLRPDLAGLAARCLLPALRRVLEAPRHRRNARNDQRGVVLLRHVEAVGVLLIDRHHVVLGGRLVENRRPALAAVEADVGAAVVDLQDGVRVVRVEPHAVVVAMRVVDRHERLAAVDRLLQAQLVDPDFVLVLRVDVDVVEVERPRAQALAAVDHRPRLAGVVRAVETAGVAEALDHGVEHARIAARDLDVDLADQILGQAIGDVLPRLAAIGGLVDAALTGRTAADDVPALAEALVHGGVENVGVLPVHFNVAATGLVVHEQRLLPGLAAVDGLEDAALVVRPERRTEGRQPHRVGVEGMHLDAADLARLLQAHELPLRAGVG